MNSRTGQVSQGFFICRPFFSQEAPQTSLSAVALTVAVLVWGRVQDITLTLCQDAVVVFWDSCTAGPGHRRHSLRNARQSDRDLGERRDSPAPMVLQVMPFTSWELLLHIPLAETEARTSFLQTQTRLLPSILSASQRTWGLRPTQESHLTEYCCPSHVVPRRPSWIMGVPLSNLKNCRGGRAEEASTTHSRELDRAKHLHSVQNGLDLCVIQPRLVCFPGTLPALPEPSRRRLKTRAPSKE